MDKVINITTTEREVTANAAAQERVVDATITTDARQVAVDVDADTREVSVNITTQQRMVAATVQQDVRDVDVNINPTVRSVVVEQSNLQGRKGDRGLSAYELAVLHGFQGSETDWLASLRGQDGLGAVAIAYVHEQNVPSNEWDVLHNLNFFPAVRLENTAGDDGFGYIKHIDRNRFKIILDGAMAGRAYCS